MVHLNGMMMHYFIYNSTEFIKVSWRFHSMNIIHLGGSMAEWLTQTSNLKDGKPHEFKPSQSQAVISLSRKLYIQCSILVGSRNRFKSVSKSNSFLHNQTKINSMTLFK